MTQSRGGLPKGLAEGLAEGLATLHARVRALAEKVGAASALRWCSDAQCHGTLSGLEGVWSDAYGGVVNANLAARCARHPEATLQPVSFQGVLGSVRASLREPMCVEVGGFSPQHARHHFEETLCVGSDGLLVALGWPRDESGALSSRLGELRCGLEAHGVVHKYHIGRLPGASPMPERDDDLYAVLAAVDVEAWQRDREGVEAALLRLQEAGRASLSRAPHRLLISTSTVSFVRYHTTDFSPPCEHLPLADATPAALERWYRALR